jgi:hypothetical protein
MKTFYVRYTRYVTEQEEVTIAVEADNEEWAIEKAKTGNGEEVNWDTYDRTIEDEYWDEAEVLTEDDMGFLNKEDDDE